MCMISLLLFPDLSETKEDDFSSTDSIRDSSFHISDSYSSEYSDESDIEKNNNLFAPNISEEIVVSNISTKINVPENYLVQNMLEVDKLPRTNNSTILDWKDPEVNHLNFDFNGPSDVNPATVALLTDKDAYDFFKTICWS